jgi:hypothetical protein
MWRSGSVLLTDLDRSRLELTWRSRPRRQRPDLARTVEEVAAGMSGRVVRYDPPDADQHRFQSSELVYDRDEHVAVVAMASQTSERAAVLRLWLDGMERPLDLARQVIASFRDHARDEPAPWSLYDLAFWVPPKFRLTDRRMLAGSVRLAFAAGAVVLSFSKVAGDSGKSDPVEWFARAHKKDRRWYRCRQERCTVGQHEGTLTTGRLPWYRWPGQWNRRELRAVCWACPVNGRMFEVQATGWRLEAGLLESATEGVVCHIPR